MGLYTHKITSRRDTIILLHTYTYIHNVVDKHSEVYIVIYNN